MVRKKLNGQKKHDHNKVLEKSEECTKQSLQATVFNHILKITNNFAYSNTSPKMY